MATSPETDAAPPSLAATTARGLSWNFIGNLGANGLRLAVIPILGRLLTPHDFGVVAAALTVVAFAMFLKDAGVGTALVQRNALTREHAESAFSFSVLFGIGIAVLIAATAPLVARFYSLPDLSEVIQWLALMFVFRGIATVPQALARRDMQFRALAIIDLGSYAIGSLTTITCAVLGLGAWSLVVGYVCETAVGSLAILMIQRVRYTAIPQLAHLRDLWRYGAGHTLGEIAGFVAYQGDNMVVGYALGARELGLYTRAYDLMRYPSVAFSNVAGSVLLSAFSRIQEDRARLARVYRRAIFGTSVLLLPTSVALLILAPELVVLVLGDAWTEAVLPFQILAISMVPRTTFKIGATIARAAGDVFAVAAANILYGVLVVGGALVTVRWGVVGVAVSTAIAVYVNFVILSHLGLRRTHLTWREFGAAHVQPLIATVLMVGALVPATLALRASDIAPALVVVIASVAGLVGGVGALVIGVRRRQQDWTWFYGGLSARLRFLPRLREDRHD